MQNLALCVEQVYVLRLRVPGQTPGRHSTKYTTVTGNRLMLCYAVLVCHLAAIPKAHPSAVWSNEYPCLQEGFSHVGFPQWGLHFPGSHPVTRLQATGSWHNDRRCDVEGRDCNLAMDCKFGDDPWQEGANCCVGDGRQGLGQGMVGIGGRVG